MGNKGVRSLMTVKYGRRCMLCHRKLRKKKGCVTYHHIIPISEGGETTIENGAILCPDCHADLHQQDFATQKILNDKIKKYKRSIDNN